VLEFAINFGLFPSHWWVQYVYKPAVNCLCHA